MSWGATAFTPIISYNNPPFGFAERPNNSDFPTCPEDPWSGTDNLKDSIDRLFRKRDRPDTVESFMNLSNNSNKNILIVLILLAILFFYFN